MKDQYFKQAVNQVAQEAQQPQVQPTRPMFVAPAPLPCVIQVGQVPGEKIIRLTTHTPAGINDYFIDLAAAMKIGDDLRQAASAARTGLVLPTN